MRAHGTRGRHGRHGIRGRALALLAAALLAGGCAPSPEPPASDTEPRAGTLRVLASSELTDVTETLAKAAQATGVEVRFTWAGTLDAVEQIASGKADERYDAVWLSSNDYLRLRPEAAGKLTSETPLMTSPVAIGVKTATVRTLGWSADRVTWADVHKAVAAGRLTYGMTDPVRSNSGFAALVSVASGLSGAQGALTGADVTSATPRLKEFFGGQRLTSGSSGWLAEAYTRRGTVDALINYESVLLSMNRDSHAGLTVIRPRDGVVTADYPFSLLTSASARAKEDAGKLTAHLRTAPVQRSLAATTLRQPVVGVPASSALARRELPFPGSRTVADGLLASYENVLRRRSRTVYVLDTSSSMGGERLTRLKEALARLTGTADSALGRRFRDREEVTLLPFGSGVKDVVRQTVDPARPGASLDALRSSASSLTAEGSTAIFSSLREAYERLGAPGDAFTSIVLMTDGENTVGDSMSDFDSFHASLPPERRATPVFPILFGDSDRSELDHIAVLTGGQLFDATKGSLDRAFEEIRGYQ
ncbi:substrate-binding and VWA domain-containing protein [Streptomyces sp. NBC_00237]|uniref:substrate-binding and vWA domain-containing protein n=1 Tax=Streptomyces sp. NBC_00237 TaxID=2975687 RepID=UPI0022508710|nr:substrate-binding and VWA domain-containing protein [Streptomyces sp. NBC_00237]MCX5204558.1 substrate-binding and VWA domain-containing protein [Streptomyces sp. NBC_00237]